jgi:leucyl aminopeptidase
MSPSFYSTPDVRVLVAAPRAAETDVLAIPLFSDDRTTTIVDLPGDLTADVAALFDAGEFRGEAFESLWTRVEGWQARRILLLGAGERAEQSPALVRRLAMAAGLAARARGLPRVALLLRAGLGDVATVRAATDGLVASAFHVDAYRSTPSKLAVLRDVAVVVSGGGADTVAQAADEGRTLGSAVNIARSLAHEPPNVLTPAGLAERAATLCEDSPLTLEVLDEDAMRQLGMGLLLGVGQGSRSGPRLITMAYTPPHHDGSGPVLALVGKAVTFDTGGISIKPSENMDRMKYDMAGGAAVIGAMWALARLGAPIPVLGIVPAAENMPDGNAFRPGDVLTAASGTTVEITNTDAEGRLILADALWYAQEQGATHLVDVATLTGACAVALGRVTSGLFAAPPTWQDAVKGAADRAGDVVWPLPVSNEYKELLRSDIADLVNAASTRYGGAISAALFLKAFAGDRPWAHLDIAGTAWADEAKPYQPKGPTGVAVRTLVELARSADVWS